jgi:hypothetical protein
MILAVFLLSAAALFACDITYTLDGQPMIPGALTTLAAGSTHTLRVTFTEDHGRCTVPAADTIFLLNDEKWKPGKSHLPLTITETIAWETVDSRTHETVVNFTAGTPGDAALQVVRECPRGGYDETLRFTVR